jgi:hypothetical protein
MSTEIQRRSNDIASWPVHVGVSDGPTVIAEAVLPATTPVIIGDAETCNIALPARCGIRERVIVRPESKRMIIFLDDDLHVQASVDQAGTELPLRGFVKDWREGYPALRSAALTRPKVVVRIGELSILLHYDPMFARG